jgi:signal peptidase II
MTPRTAPAPRVVRRVRVVAIAVVVAVLAVDQATKAWAVHRLGSSSIKVFGNWFELRLSYNSGSAFSLFDNMTPLLAVVAAGVAIWLARVLRRTTDTVLAVALALVLGGAVGNLIDRLARDPSFLHGRVVDFIRVGSWPIFNVADSAITIGVVLLAIRVWKAPPAPRVGNE